ncbi:hypothetical protein HLA87_02585 [Mycoplasma miroungigenitalium]|uniref:Uncharacterized protein n=1 Tax=Mycoplasma miroungigenitalium TaxID=754515 RepID=A0A6M4J9P3_9MOLU|nr:hypothetical protein [Mycoplasma miroungigenitalium]QJR43660.1 hypothetical protein HLA87_02585 [Mycoplasma miroungigenitalium]
MKLTQKNFKYIVDSINLIINQYEILDEEFGSATSQWLKINKPKLFNSDKLKGTDSDWSTGLLDLVSWMQMAGEHLDDIHKKCNNELVSKYNKFSGEIIARSLIDLHTIIKRVLKG